MCYLLSDGGWRCEDYERLRGENAAFFAPQPVPDVPDVVWIKDDMNKLWNNETFSKSSICAALKTLSTVKGQEPAITDAARLAARESGSECAHLEYRVKSPSSLTRKINLELEDSITAGSPAKAMTIAASMKDVVRYTVVHQDHEKLTETTRKVAKSLKANGWKLTTFKQFYTDGAPYKGIHIIGETPSGTAAEVQIHSADSLAIKNQNHLDYEVYRDPNQAPKVRRQAREACIARSRQLRTPKDLDSLTLQDL